MDSQNTLEDKLNVDDGTKTNNKTKVDAVKKSNIKLAKRVKERLDEKDPISKYEVRWREAEKHVLRKPSEFKDTGSKTMVMPLHR